MPSHGQAVVTGAFSNIVRYGVHSLLKSGVAVRTLTRNPTGSTRSSGGCQRLHWTSVTEGSRWSMDRCSVLYNTYWVRFGRGRTTFDQAVENSKVLFDAAARAGVGRIVHFSVANASTEAKLPYFRGKGQVEEILTGMGIPYAIIRPTLVFGEGDLLLNNMAWALRRFPVFPVFGDGDYRVQPIYAEDLAALAVAAGSDGENSIADAAGPETFSFEELLSLLASAVGARVRLVHTPLPVEFALVHLVGLLLRNVVLTRGKVDGLMAGLLTSESPPTDRTRLAEWLNEGRAGLG